MAELVAAYRSAAQPIVDVVRLYDGDDVDLVHRAMLRAGARMVRPGSHGSQIAPRLLPDPDSRSTAAHCSPGSCRRWATTRS
jgi:nicotinamidase-related amidase